MSDKRQVRVNLAELSGAFEFHLPGRNAYLDLETGEIIWVTEETGWQLEALWEELPEEDSYPLAALETLLSQHDELPDWQKEELRNAARVEAVGSSRYLDVDPEPYSDYRDMERFILTLEDERLANRLEAAIRGRGAFRRFKALVARTPWLQQAWYDFQARRIEARVQEWLDSAGIEAI